jgi:hypothetical protein
MLSALVAVVISLSTAALAQGTKPIDTVLIEGKASIGTKAPSGWVPRYDPNQLGLCVIYALKGRTFNDSPVIIYPRIVHGKNIEDVIRVAVDHFTKTSDTFRLEKKKDYRSKRGLTFVVRHYLNGPGSNAFEAVGYLAHKGRIFILVFSSRTRTDFERHIASFFSALDHVTPYSSNMSPLSGTCLQAANQ